MSGFKYRIEFIKGFENAAANSFSRIPSKECAPLSDNNVYVINWVDTYIPVDSLSKYLTKLVKIIISMNFALDET